MTFTFTFTLLNILVLLIGILAIVDGVTRLRGRRVNSILAIVEIVLAVLLLLAVFFSAFVGLPLNLIAIALLVVAIVLIITRGTGRGRGYLGITAVIAILDLVYILHLLGVIAIP
jgi:hypothetical protein